MKLISEQWSDDVNYLVEEDPKTGKKNMFIEGIMLQTEVKNKNGRIYPLEVMKKEVKRYNKEYIDQKRAYGELNAFIDNFKLKDVMKEKLPLDSQVVKLLKEKEKK